MFGLALAVIRNKATAEEVTQEVFLELWRKASRFDPARGSATAWILTLTKSRAIDQVRRAELTRARDTKWTQGHIDRDFDTVTEAVLTDLEHGHVRAAMAALSVPQRQAIVLTYFRGMSTTEISRLLLIPAGTVKTRCRDNLTRMRTEMTETVTSGVATGGSPSFALGEITEHPPTPEHLGLRYVLTDVSEASGQIYVQ